MFYATKDSGNDCNNLISENATIKKFKTFDEAKAWLLIDYDPEYFDQSTAVIEAGEWGDCWIKTSIKPEIGDSMLSPFGYAQIHIQKPGTHSGGKVYWITPKAEVLIVKSIAERE